MRMGELQGLERENFRNLKMLKIYEMHRVCCPVGTVAEFKEFERRFKIKPRFKYGWFHLKLYQMFQDLSRRLI